MEVDLVERNESITLRLGKEKGVKRRVQHNVAVRKRRQKESGRNVEGRSACSEDEEVRDSSDSEGENTTTNLPES